MQALTASSDAGELVKLGIIEQRKARVDYNNINNEELHAELRARDAELEKQSQGHGKVKREQVLADTERLRKVSDQLQGQTIVIDDDDSLLEAKNRVSGSRGAHGRKVQRYSGSMSAPGRLHD